MTISSIYDYTLDKTPFQANGWVFGDQLAPDALGLKGGGFAVAYSNANVNKGFIIVDFYDADHHKVGTHKLVQSNLSLETQGEPSLAQLNNGNVVVVWDGYDPAGKQSGIKATIFEPDGSQFKTEFALTAGNTTNIADLDVTALSNGNFAVSYTQGTNIMFKVHNANGVEQVGGTVANTTPGFPMQAQMTALSGPDGGFVVTWSDYGLADVPLRARIFNDNGTQRVAEFKIDGFGDNTQASVAATKDGGFAVAYTDTGWFNEGASDKGITLKVYDGNGGTVSAAVHVNTPGASKEADPDITVLDNGFIAVSWSSPTNAADNDLHVRVFTDEGVPVLNEFIIGDANGDAAKSSLASLIGGKFFAAYENSAKDVTGGQITGVVMGVRRVSTGDDSAEDFSGDALKDVVNAKGGNDTVKGGGGEDEIQGGNGADAIRGQTGDDSIDGGIGKDDLRGGKGDDEYHVDMAGEAVEAADQGIDTVYASLNYALGGNIEKLKLEGTDDYNGTGNALANEITGNFGDNVLDGKAGKDTMSGGSGGDTYVVTAGDKIIEKSNGGYDTVKSSSTWGLSEHVEKLILMGSDDIIGFGNAEDNTIIGNAGDNNLAGFAGSDILTGGAGADVFLFAEPVQGTGDVDEITDFQLGIDEIYMAGASFPGLGKGDLKASAFHIGAAAADASDRIIYDKATGSIFFDADGTGNMSQQWKFAEVIDNLNLSANDFFVY